MAINLIEAPKTWHVVEFKTHAQKSFTDLAAKKVRESKPQHYAQMQVYMLLTEISRAIYLAVNKNTDDLYVERIELDKAFAAQLLEKAGRIIFAPNPHRDVADGVHAAARRTGAKAALALDTVSRGARAECETQIKGSACAAPTQHGGRGRLPACAQRTGAHELGAVAQARIRH